MNGNVSVDPEDTKTVYMDLDAQQDIKFTNIQNTKSGSSFQVHPSYLMPDSDTSVDRASQLSYKDDDTISTRTSTPADFDRASTPGDFGPKRTQKTRECKKHPYHTPEQLKKCLELMEKNRVASAKSRFKKITTIDQQNKEIDTMAKKLKDKNAVIRNLIKEKSELIKNLNSLKQYIARFQHKIHENSSDVEVIDVEKVDKSSSSAQDGVELADSEKLNCGDDARFSFDEIPAHFQNLVEDIINKNTPDLKRTVHNILKAPLETAPTNTKDPRPMLMESTTTTIYAPKPNALNIEEMNEPHLTVEKTTVFRSPDLEKLLEKLYPNLYPSPTNTEKKNP
uniref:Uncharacterized protein n=1 Tax=Acrobeloides nanus TaxID=290746 RepID=A0A914DSV0_9BILA